MGSYSTTRIDGLSLWSTKSYVDEETLSLLQERDRRETPYKDLEEEGELQDQMRYEYAIPARDMRERLDALGFTLARAENDYEWWRGMWIEQHEGWLDQDAPGFPLTNQDQVDAVKAQTFSWWKKAVAKLAAMGWTPRIGDHAHEVPEARAFFKIGGMDQFFSDGRFYLRAALEALPAAGEVTVDLSHLIGGGYIGSEEPISLVARQTWSQTYPVYGPVVILTEGKLDSRVLKQAFYAMSPHLADFFGFLEFDSTKAPGGSDHVAKLVKSFVAARLSSRMIAVFDNDAAGLESLATLKGLRLPANIKVMTLPHNDLAAAYPTEGPQGMAVMDVNGLAASMEMFFGRQALTDKNGSLYPVRWSAFMRGIKRYQGAIESKGAVEERFFELLEKQTTPQEARAAFPDMARLIDRISFAFAKPTDMEILADERNRELSRKGGLTSNV